jgi:cytochrome o ubiquinol oxidase subunit III
MTESIAALALHHKIEEEVYNKTVFGFWVYVMTDCVLFATLFATYAVLHNSTFGGPSSNELFSLPSALAETMFLLTSTFTCGLATLAAYHKEKAKALTMYGLTFLLGASFLTMELTEFHHFIQEGNSWQRSAFLSAFFTLVGTHGLHVTTGLFWMLIMMGHIFYRGFTFSTLRRLECLGMFWHFLDIIWVFIFTFVYLMGVR